ncbi:MAG: DJ-1/PfpI family protein [Alphaproteobacteria bacterium]|nr:DJ-1/PfpI family protein [Alphaproteobacteria bacterium]
MNIAIITLDGFNELDSFIASAILNRAAKTDWTVQICGPDVSVTSMNGVRIDTQQTIEYANDADVVLFGSGTKTADYVADDKFVGRFALDKTRQFIGSQCSGALFLQRLGLMGERISTDTMTAPKLENLGLEISTKALHVEGNVASAGGCLSSVYLAAWAITKLADWTLAAEVVHYVAPIGEKDHYVEMTKRAIFSNQ